MSLRGGGVAVHKAPLDSFLIRRGTLPRDLLPQSDLSDPLRLPFLANLGSRV